jgi:NADH-quinone oxidoreductase subunit G
MIRESGIVFDEIEAEAVDSDFASATGAGMIFGVTGGVTEAVLRRISDDKSLSALRSIAYQGVRGMQGVKETKVPFGDKELSIAIVSGLGNAAALIEKIKEGAHYDFVEVMACPGGCVSGAGQPYVSTPQKQKRASGLYAADMMSSIKRSEENPLVMNMYSSLLKGRVHELLHVHYGLRSKSEEEVR